MEQVNIDKAIFLHVSTRCDEDKAMKHPMAFADCDDDVDPGLKQMLLDANVRSADRQDRYNEICHVSICHNKEPMHLILDPDFEGHSTDPRVLIFDEEVTLLNKLFEVLGAIQFEFSVVVGWDVHTQWAKLVTKSIRYKLQLPTGMYQDPMKRWPTNERLLDLQALYLQGVSPAVRRLGELKDALHCWCGEEPEAGMYPSNRDMAGASGAEWVDGTIGLDLVRMFEDARRVLRGYYGQEPKVMYGVPGFPSANVCGPKPIT